MRFSVRLEKQNRFVLLFAHSKSELENGLQKIQPLLSPEALLWILYPKESSGRQTDLTRDKGWEALDALMLQRLTLISFSEEWSAFLLRNARHNTSSPKEKKENGSEPYIDAKTKTVTIPNDFAAALSYHPDAMQRFQAYAFSHRKEYVVWITSAKKPETRAGRVAKAIQMLLAGKKNPGDK